MKYYLDVNAIVHLIENRKKQINSSKDIFVSRLVIDEMLKNLKKNYERQRNQFLFLMENKITIDWRLLDNVIFLEPFGFKFSYNLPYTKMAFDNILKYDNYLDYCHGEVQENIMDSVIKGSIAQMQDIFINNYMYYFDAQLAHRKTYFQEMKEHKIKKEILKQCIDTGIYILKSHNLINSKIEKDINYNRGMKYYYKSKKVIDFYIDATVNLLKNKEIERNDGADLYHLAYIDRNDNNIFVTDDNKLRDLCNKISNGSSINVYEYIRRISKNSFS
jgi:predicted nucleic acid-binding protein